MKVMRLEFEAHAAGIVFDVQALALMTDDGQTCLHITTNDACFLGKDFPFEPESTIFCAERGIDLRQQVELDLGMRITFARLIEVTASAYQRSGTFNDLETL